LLAAARFVIKRRCFQEVAHPMVLLSLLPIIAGVSLASMKGIQLFSCDVLSLAHFFAAELTFTWTALIAASAANLAASLKNVVTKGVMKKPWAQAMGSQNNYSVVTLLALIATLPFVLLFDVRSAPAVYKQVRRSSLIPALC